MAVTTIHPIKSTLKKALDYITDPQKTEEKLLVSSYGCSVETADIEMEFTLKQCYQKGNNLAHHLIQSFEPGEVSYEDAHRIGKELAEEILGGKYEYVLTTHIDKGHVHNHLIFCAADFVQHRKYISNKRACMESAMSVTGFAGSMVCLSLFPERKREKAGKNIRPPVKERAGRKSCVS